MINAPWFFTGIWTMIKPWLDPVTAAKIVIVGSDYLPTLLEYIDISQIPEEYGGKRTDFGWNYPENCTETDDYLESAKGNSKMTEEYNQE